MRGKLTLNYDGKDVVLDIQPPDKGVALQLRTTYRTVELAENMAGIIADRMGLRRRGSGWHKNVK